MELNTNNDQDNGVTDLATDTDTGEGRDTRMKEIERTKDFVQSVLNKRRLRLNTQGLVSLSAPTSPISNVSEYDFVWNEEEARSVKRRREDIIAKDKGEASGFAPSLATKVRQVIQAMGKEIRAVAEYAKERNTKKEIKEAASSLRSLMSQIQTSEAQALLQTMGRHLGTEDSVDDELQERIKALEVENQKLKEDNEAFKKEIRDLEMNGGRRKMRDGLFINNGNYTQFAETEELEWPEDIYKSAIRAAGSPLKADKDTDLLFLLEEGCVENEYTMEEYQDRYPELNEIQGKFGAIMVTTKRMNEDLVAEGHDRWIFKMEVTDDRADFFESLTRLKSLMLRNERKRVAIYPPGWDIPARTTMKMLEWVFRDSDIICQVHTKKQEDMQPSINKNRGEVLIVRQDGKDYAGTLRTFKEKIKPESTGAKAIRTIREARDGSMVVVLNKDSQHLADHLRQEIKEAGCIKIVKDINSRNMTLLVNEIDGVTSREEVKEVLCKETGIDENQLQVSELRTSYGGNRTAAVILPKEEGETLLNRERLRIGLSWCPIKERVDVLRCFRCWQYDHIARNCTVSLDSSKLCRKCGEEGHLAKNCDREEKCLTCKRSGHTARSGKCPEFRKAVARERLNRKNKKRY